MEVKPWFKNGPLLGWWNSLKLQNMFVLQPLRTWWLNFQGAGEVWYTPLKILPSQKESNGKQSSKKNIFQRLCPKLHGCNGFIRISTRQCNVLVLISSQTTQHNKPCKLPTLKRRVPIWILVEKKAPYYKRRSETWIIFARWRLFCQFGVLSGDRIY